MYIYTYILWPVLYLEVQGTYDLYLVYNGCKRLPISGSTSTVRGSHKSGG